MFFMGKCVCGGQNCADNTVVVTDTVENIVLKNSIVDRMLLSRSTEMETEDFPSWNYDTIIDAMFKGNLAGGNIAYMIENISSIRVKRRKKGGSSWLTIYDAPIHSEADLKFECYDKYAASDTVYEYGLTPVVDGQEGYMNYGEIKSWFYGCYLLEKNYGYSTDLDVTKGTITRNRQTAAVTPLSGKYPYVFINGESDYDSGTFKMMFLPRDESGEYTKDGAYAYREKIKDFLNDGRPKIMKLQDGRIWLIMTTDGITEDNGDIEGYVHHSFNWVEIGDPESGRDLYDNDLSDINMEA